MSLSEGVPMVFDAYASYYDLLYRDKDYPAEAEYVASHIQNYSPEATTVLELGCGTGAHAEHLARMGYSVHGVDLSTEMLARAEERKSGLPDDVATRLSFAQGDVRSVRTGQTYDVAISLFHVMSYQSTNSDLKAAFETAAVHLSPGGLFLFDFWYGPAVLTQRPETRIRHLENSEIEVIRIAEPEMLVNQNLVDVNYQVFVEDKNTQKIEKLQETHRMRYFFLPELAWYHGASWTELASEEWISGNSLGADSWSGMQVLSRI
jgi:SAM-dependent methyltransferase